MDVKKLIKVAEYPDRFVKSIISNKKEKVDFKYSIAVVAIIKNEASYIREWVEYHFKIVGIEHFYLFDNDSTDNTILEIKEYINAGIVDIIPFSGVARQLPAYNCAIKKFKNQCKYMAFIDADEFIVLLDKKENILSIIESIMKTDRKIGGIAVNWRMYGSSGHVKKPRGGGYLKIFCIGQKKMVVEIAV